MVHYGRRGAPRAHLDRLVAAPPSEDTMRLRTIAIALTALNDSPVEAPDRVPLGGGEDARLTRLTDRLDVDAVIANEGDAVTAR